MNHNKQLNMIIGIMYVAISLVFSLMLLYFMFNAADTFTVIGLVPFMVAAVAVTIKYTLSLLSLFNQTKIYKSLNTLKGVTDKIYLVAFLIFWFGFLIAFDYYAVKSSNIQLLLFTLIFWIAGIFLIIKNLKKK